MFEIREREYRDKSFQVLDEIALHLKDQDVAAIRKAYLAGGLDTKEILATSPQQFQESIRVAVVSMLSSGLFEGGSYTMLGMLEQVRDEAAKSSLLFAVLPKPPQDNVVQSFNTAPQPTYDPGIPRWSGIETEDKRAA